MSSLYDSSSSRSSSVMKTIPTALLMTFQKWKLSRALSRPSQDVIISKRGLILSESGSSNFFFPDFLQVAWHFTLEKELSRYPWHRQLHACGLSLTYSDMFIPGFYQNVGALPQILFEEWYSTPRLRREDVSAKQGFRVNLSDIRGHIPLYCGLSSIGFPTAHTTKPWQV